MWLHFHIKDARDPPHVALLFITLLSFDWLPLQGQHQQRPLLRHAGHQEETHCKQEVKRGDLLNVNPHRLHPSAHEHLSDRSQLLSDCLQMCTWWGDMTTLGETRELQKTQIDLHGAINQPTCFSSCTPPPPPLRFPWIELVSRFPKSTTAMFQVQMHADGL